MTPEQREAEQELERQRRAVNGPAFITGLEFDNEDLVNLIKLIVGNEPWVEAVGNAFSLAGNFVIGRQRTKIKEEKEEKRKKEGK